MPRYEILRTGAAPDAVHAVPVRVIAADAATRAAVLAGLRGPCRTVPATAVDQPAQRVVVVVAATIADAFALVRRARRSSGERLVVVADELAPAGVLTAVRAGACAILLRANADPGIIAAAVLAAATGDGTMPHETCVRVLEQAAEPAAHDASNRVTERELHVIRLVADGYDNAEIARRLKLSHHTIKNVIYDLMARLRLRNRTHVAAYAVRAGLI